MHLETQSSRQRDAWGRNPKARRALHVGGALKTSVAGGRRVEGDERRGWQVQIMDLQSMVETVSQMPACRYSAEIHRDVLTSLIPLTSWVLLSTSLLLFTCLGKSFHMSNVPE